MSYEVLEVIVTTLDEEVRRTDKLRATLFIHVHTMEVADNHAVAEIALPEIRMDEVEPNTPIPPPSTVTEAEPVAGTLPRIAPPIHVLSYDMACVRVPNLLAPVTTSPRLPPVAPAAD